MKKGNPFNLCLGVFFLYLIRGRCSRLVQSTETLIRLLIYLSWAGGCGHWGLGPSTVLASLRPETVSHRSVCGFYFSLVLVGSLRVDLQSVFKGVGLFY